jgi:hypothetical protein
MSPASANLVPQCDVTVHIVLDDFGKSGRAYRDEQDASFGTVVELARGVGQRLACVPDC